MGGLGKIGEATNATGCMDAAPSACESPPRDPAAAPRSIALYLYIYAEALGHEQVPGQLGSEIRHCYVLHPSYLLSISAQPA